MQLHADRRTRQQWTRLADAQWRDAVLRRDDYTCQVPGCEANTNLDAAHIIPRSHAATRFDLPNGVTLCRHHHQHFTDNPTEFHRFIASRSERSTTNFYIHT